MPALINIAPDWFDPVQSSEWIKTNWTICLPFVVIYLITVYGLQHWMTNRKPFNTKRSLVIWNSLLAIFSTAGAIQAIYDSYMTLKVHGLAKGLCDNSFLSDKYVLFIGWLFIWSKIVEFGDTIFIVLRRKPLQFLQVYHHATTCICCFFYYSTGTAICRWTLCMNFTVHSFMYSYFAIVGMGYRVPRPFAMILTSAQLSQMLIGMGINIYHINRLLAGIPCASSIGLASFSITVYCSYAILFAHMFMVKYFSTKSKIK
ncbi:elongation of very long chain fatty acids protein 6-like [Panonychus citri]|uniref:elongation of very long chain fatty acids protein 6-like n=1 Tax=Panonychus citri TaxID=50023 RepID=UPI002307DF5A|nr:elongation of very long chain fatty acids protein 6-like [Panonychus citri]